MKEIKKVLVLILTLALITSLIACGSQETADGDTTGNGQTRHSR